jgi:hypothetical protein
VKIFELKTENKKLIIGLAIAASLCGGIGLYYVYQVYQATRPAPPQPKTPYNYTEPELIGLIRGTGNRCKEPAIVTPTAIPNGRNYLIACYATTGTYEIAITEGSQPIIKKLKFN